MCLHDMADLDKSCKHVGVYLRILNTLEGQVERCIMEIFGQER